MIRRRVRKIIQAVFIITSAVALVIIAVMLFLSIVTVSAVNVPRPIPGCKANPSGIYETEGYHHVLPSCTWFNEKYFVNSTGKHSIEKAVRVEINSLGFRNDEYNLEKENGTTRIIILGDSFAYGFGVELKNTFFKILENSLSERYGKKVEVWDVAVPSWSTDIEYLVVKNKIRAYSPDIIILMFDESDLYGTPVYETMAYFNKGELVGILDNGKDLFEIKSQIQKTMSQDAVKNLSFFYIQKIADNIKQDKIPFFVVFYPYPTGNETNEKIWILPLSSMLNKSNISFYSLWPYFLSKGNPSSYYHTDGHWNENGSRVVAGLLEEEITSKYPQIFS